MPAAIAIKMMGTSSMIPLAKTKQTIRTGSATTIRMLATTFATPQVSLNMKPMDFTNSQINIATVKISNIYFPFS